MYALAGIQVFIHLPLTIVSIYVQVSYRSA